MRSLIIEIGNGEGLGIGKVWLTVIMSSSIDLLSASMFNRQIEAHFVTIHFKLTHEWLASHACTLLLTAQSFVIFSISIVMTGCTSGSYHTCMVQLPFRNTRTLGE